MMGLNNLNAMPFGGGKRVCPGIGQVKLCSWEEEQKKTNVPYCQITLWLIPFTCDLGQYI
jgi:hypothetical protein